MFIYVGAGSEVSSWADVQVIRKLDMLCICTAFNGVR